MTGTLGFNRIAYFGDSLTDSDEFFSASSAVAFFGIPPLAAGYAGQFSNGPVYSDLTPDLLGVEGGDALNFAVGGAQLLTDRTIGEVLAGSGLIRPDATPEALGFRVDFRGQVDRFLADPVAQSDLSETAASIFIGVNDFNDFVPNSAETAVADAIAFGAGLATTALTDATPLFTAGVGVAILHTIPNVSVFPSTQDAPPELELLGSVASQSYNAALREGAAQLEALGVDVRIVDTAAIYGAVERDFESFGFQTLDDTVVLGSNGAGGPNPAVAGIPLDQVAFFDSVHPTAAFHGILAGFEAASLSKSVSIGSSENDRLFESQGEDLVVAAQGNDKIFLRAGDDIALAGLGNDLVVAGSGNDLIAGGAGRDRLLGGSGEDIIADGLGNDVVAGGGGDDLLIDGQGSDVHRGGWGDDIFVFTEAVLRGGGEERDGFNVFSGGRGEDTLILRVADAENVDIDPLRADSFLFRDLGLLVRSVENVVIVEGTDLSGEDFFDERFATADLWNFI